MRHVAYWEAVSRVSDRVIPGVYKPQKCISVSIRAHVCILIVVYVFLDAATLTEVFPCFFLSCKANVRV